MALTLVYLGGLTAAGIVGPDEPRYASIGRAMAESGDWLTPRLWGEPWFEKPPLVYWLAAAGFKAGLGPELAPRLPVSIISIAFIIFYFWVISKEFGEIGAGYAAAVLATSALWVAFSHVAVTDIPMSAAFAAAMLCGLRWHSTGNRRYTTAAAALLGLAVLAKGLVPLILAAPLALLAFPRWRDWLRPAPVLAFLLVAAPWYVASTILHGRPFLDEFFGRHHFARFAGGVMLHGQPFWYYAPVLAGGLYPWSPLLIALFRRRLYSDRRRVFLGAWAGFGFLFFSAASGKLPGYLLPLFPALAALCGLALAELRRARAMLTISCLLLMWAPVAAATVPPAFASGLSRTAITGWNWYFAAVCVLAAAAVWRLESRGRRAAAAGVLVGLAALGAVYMKAAALPALDRVASSRLLWRSVAPHAHEVCVENLHRNWRYSLNYYSIRPLPDCAVSPRPLRIVQRPGAPPSVER